MLTRSRFRCGVGKHEKINLDIRKKDTQILKMRNPNEGEDLETKVEEQFQQMFLNMQRMIVELYEYKNKRDVTSSSKGTKAKNSKERDDGNEPPSPPSWSSYCLFSYH